MTQDIYWELLIWLFRSFMGVTAFAFTVAAYQAMRCRKRTDKVGGNVRKAVLSAGKVAESSAELTSGGISPIFRECPAAFRMKPFCPA